MPLLDIFWSMVMFFLFIAWLMVLFSVLRDVFRSDMGGFAKALWVLFIIVIPWLGVLVYLIANGDAMAERTVRMEMEQEDAVRQFVQRAASGAPSTADELTKLAALRESGVISDAEFQAQKAALLG